VVQLSYVVAVGFLGFCGFLRLATFFRREGLQGRGFGLLGAQLLERGLRLFRA